MSKLIKFPSSYVFAAGYDVYNLFMTKHISSLPVNGNNISYYSTEKNLPDNYTPEQVVEYYRNNIDRYNKESANITVLDSPLLNSLVDMVYRYRKNNHISETDFNLLFNRSLNCVKNNVDFSTVYYIYLRYYSPMYNRPTLRDSIISHLLSKYPIFHYNSIYSKEDKYRIQRFDTLLTTRLKRVKQIHQFNKILGKEE